MAGIIVRPSVADCRRIIISWALDFRQEWGRVDLNDPDDPVGSVSSVPSQLGSTWTNYYISSIQYMVVLWIKINYDTIYSNEFVIEFIHGFLFTVL